MRCDTLFDYLPIVFSEIRELRYIYQTVEAEFALLKEHYTAQYNNFFIKTADTTGVERWEKALQLTLSGMTTVEKRFEIEARLNEDRPYYFAAIIAKLEKLCGSEGVSFERNVAAKSVTVKIALTQKGNYTTVADLLNRLVPADMSINLSLMYNQHGALSGYTHGQLTQFKHEELRSEVMNSG